MIQRTIIIKWKAGTQKSEIDRVVTEIKALSGIDGVTDFIAAPNLRDGSNEYDFMFSLRSPSMDFLKNTYGPHPFHRRLQDSMKQVMGSIVAADIEI